MNELVWKVVLLGGCSNTYKTFPCGAYRYLSAPHEASWLVNLHLA